MFKVSCFLLSLFILLDSSDCDTHQKQDERLRLLEANVNQLKTDVAELKQAEKKAAPEHHYELRPNGVRTWRFDPATGETCLQLTSADDWKRKDTKSQSRECSDAMQYWMAMPVQTEQQIKTAETYSKHVVERACGTI